MSDFEIHTLNISVDENGAVQFYQIGDEPNNFISLCGNLRIYITPSGRPTLFIFPPDFSADTSNAPALLIFSQFSGLLNFSKI